MEVNVEYALLINELNDFNKNLVKTENLYTQEFSDSEE